MHPELAIAVVSNCSTSERRIAANRANGRKSTGPRTPEGKAAVAGNATKHGLRSERVVETRPSRRHAFEEFTNALRRELKPVGVMQSIVFDRIAILAWKLKTLPAVERRMIRDVRDERRKRYAERYERVGDAAEPIAPGELSEVGLVARWFHSGRGEANAYATLRRYEAGIERSFYRACNELKRLQKEADDADEDDSAEQTQPAAPVAAPEAPAAHEVAADSVGRPLLADIDAERRSCVPERNDSRPRRESARCRRPTASTLSQPVTSSTFESVGASSPCDPHPPTTSPS